MLYNIIGDIHGRNCWINLVREDAINIFVGDYFSPYEDMYFEDVKRNFLDIIEYKKKHWDNTILLIGNHDEDHWHICEGYSRHDRENEDEIRRLFEMHKGLFQVAYSIENKVLVTHAGVSYVWFEWQKNHKSCGSAWNLNFDDPDEVESPITHEMVKMDNPIKYLSAETPEKAYELLAEKHFRYGPDEKIKEPEDGEFIEWKDKLWEYNAEKKKFEVYSVTPDEVADFVNWTWLQEKKYSAFDFRNNCGRNDYYGNSITHGPMWIRPEALVSTNIFKFSKYWQVVGHTQGLDINDRCQIAFCDCLGISPASVLYDSEKETFEENKM